MKFVQLGTQIKTQCKKENIQKYTKSINRNFVWHNVFTQLNVHCSTAGVIKDMLRIKSRQALIPGFSSSGVDFLPRDAMHPRY